jgi:hypothetical protein
MAWKEEIKKKVNNYVKKLSKSCRKNVKKLLKVVKKLSKVVTKSCHKKLSKSLKSENKFENRRRKIREATEESTRNGLMMMMNRGIRRLDATSSHLVISLSSSIRSFLLDATSIFQNQTVFLVPFFVPFSSLANFRLKFLDNLFSDFKLFDNFL